MRSSTFKQLARRHLLPQLPGTAVAGRLLYQAPVGELLCGCHFEGSNFEPNKFVVTVFVQPLYVPAGHLVLTYGHRLRGPKGDQWWNLDEGEEVVMASVVSEIHKQAPPIHAIGESPLAFATGVAKRVLDYLDREAIACSYLRAGEIDRGAAELELCLGAIPESDYQISWVAAMRDRDLALLDDARTDAASIDAKLTAWRAETLAALRLPGS